MKRKIKLLGMLLSICCVFFITGCTSSEDESAETFIFPAVSESGGYELETDTLRCVLIADGEYKYSEYEALNENYKVKCYWSQTEMILVEQGENGTSYYREEMAPANYENPLKLICQSLEGLEFTKINESDHSDYNVFQTTRTETVEEQEQINYTEYLLLLKWIDEQEYLFSYYEFIDGATLFSTDAPEEIDPYFTPDTKWQVNVDDEKIYNVETQQEVSVNVVNSSTGKALSPNKSATTTNEYNSQIKIYIDKEDSEWEYIQFSSDDAKGSKLRIMDEVNIEKPEITEDTEIMTDEQVQFAIMLLSTLESLV